MKKRILQNWKSSVLGIVLMLFAGALVYGSKITWAEFSAFLPFCLGLIYVQDTIFKSKV